LTILRQNRISRLSLFPEEVAVPTRRIIFALPLVVSVPIVALLDEHVVLYGFLGAIAAVILGWFLYRFADRSVTKAVFIILLVAISLQQDYLGLPVEATRVARFLLFLYIIKAFLGGELKWERTPLNVTILLLFLALFTSILVADEVEATFGYLKRYLYMGILYFLVIHTLKERSFTVKALKAYAVLVFLSGLYGIWQFSGFFGTAAANVVSEVTFGLPRASGLYVDANLCGAYLGSGFPLVVGFFLGVKGKMEKALWLLAAVVILGGLLFTVSRSALLGFGCAIIVLCIYSKVLRRGYLKMATRSLYILVPLGVFFAREFYLFYVGMRNLFLQSLTVYAHVSTELHLWFYKTALKIFLHNPVLGVGVGNFHNNLRKYMEPHPIVDQLFWRATGREVRVGVHSTWLDLASDAGCLGIMAYLLVLAVVFRYFHLANRKFLARDLQLFYLSTALMGGLTALCFGGLFYSYQQTPMHWFFVGSSYVMFSLAGKGEGG
jgi:O-antigen ligase